MTGQELQRKGVALLRASGWLVEVFADRRRSRIPGWIDVIAFRRGVTLLIEVKGAGDRPRPSQIKFRSALEPHTGVRLRYAVATGLSDFVRLAEVGY